MKILTPFPVNSTKGMDFEEMCTTVVLVSAFLSFAIGHFAGDSHLGCREDTLPSLLQVAITVPCLPCPMARQNPKNTKEP